jgi:L-fuculose-phosphate aldolase
MREKELREEIVLICRRAYERGLIMSNDGNVSVRLDERRILITPSGLNKGFLSPENVVAVELDNIAPEGKLPPSTETLMHVRAYESRADVRAVIHAHPPYCTGMSIAGICLKTEILPEAVLTLGKIPTVPYALPGTEALADSINPDINKYDAVILDHHGVLIVGPDLTHAYDILERVEHVAKVQFIAEQLGGAKELPDCEISKLEKLARKRGFRKNN